MHDITTNSLWMVVTAAFVLLGSAATAQTLANISNKHLMTIKLPVDLSSVVDSDSVIFHTPTEGWVEGAVIGIISTPSQGWADVVRTSALRLSLDAHVAIETNEHEIIYMNYNRNSDTAGQVCNNENSNQDDCYLLSAPTFETTSEKYAWLNNVQSVGRMVEFNLIKGYLIYDLFAVSKLQ